MNFISVNEPLLDGNEKKYLNECIDTGWISSEGRFVRELEEGMAKYVGREYGIAVCNGTVALEIAIEALELKKGDEVIMPTFTIISCIAPLIRRGIKPVLVDADKITWNMDVNQIEEKITSKTKAIMIVHIYGLPVEVDEILRLAQKYNLKIIEDAAEAHGLKYKGKQCGSFGDISTMSFYPNKHITTGEGGILLTDDPQLAKKCQSFRNLCFLPERRFVHEELGFNFRMSNLQAAVGVAQLEKLEDHLMIKKEMGQLYDEKLSNKKQFCVSQRKTPSANNIYWIFGIVLSENGAIEAKTVMDKLKEVGIGTRPFFYPMHKQPVLRKMGLFKEESYPVSEWLGEKGFYVPSGMTLTKEQINYVSEKVLEFTNN